jgi:hypothetical protein
MASSANINIGSVAISGNGNIVAGNANITGTANIGNISMASTGNITLAKSIITGDTSNNLSITNPYSVNSRLLSFYTFNSSDLSGNTMINQANLSYDLILDSDVTINNNTLDISSGNDYTKGATINRTLILSGAGVNSIGLTVGGWFYSYNNSNRKSYIFSLSDNSNSEISMYLETNNTLNICINNYNTSLSTPDTSYVQVVSTTININTWYYFSWNIKSVVWYFYLNQNINSLNNLLYTHILFYQIHQI